MARNRLAIALVAAAMALLPLAAGCTTTATVEPTKPAAAAQPTQPAAAAQPTQPAAAAQPTQPAAAPATTGAASAAKPAVLSINPATGMPEPAPAAATGEPIKIGLITALTGNYAALGTDCRDGALMYLADRNNTMGGHPVTLVVEDSGGDTSNAINKMRKLKDSDKVSILAGPFTAAEGNAVSEYAIKEKWTQLALSGGDYLTKQDRSDYVLRPWLAQSTSFPQFAEYAYNKLNYRKIAILAADYAFGYESGGAFQLRFEELGGRIVKKVWTPLGAPDFGPYLAQIPSDVDAVFVVYAGGDATRFVAAYADYGLKGKIPLIGAGTLTDETVLKSLGDNAIGIISAWRYSAALDTPVHKKWAERVVAKYNKDPSYYSEGYYTGIGMILDETLRIAGPDYKDPLKLAAAYRQVQVNAPRGPVKIDEYNNPVENWYLRKTEKVNGKLQNTVIETFPSLSQFAPWGAEAQLKAPRYSRDWPPVK